MTVANPKWFIAKSKLITYTGAFVELYKERNHGQVHKIYAIVEFKKWHTSTVENPSNLGVYRIIKVSLVLRSAYIIPIDQDRIVIYVNNYMDWD